MKIEDFTQQMAVVPHLLAGRTDRVDTTESNPESAKSQSKADKVQLSGMSPIAAADQRDNDMARGQRVEALKASIASGEYQVPGRAVAEKMLSKLVVGGTIH